MHFPVRGGSAGDSRFASCQLGRERAGRGVGAAERVPEPVPSPARDPGPPEPPAPASEAPAARRVPHSPARRSLPLALWTVGRAGPRDPVGSRLVAAGGRSGPGRGLLAMSSAREASSRFPLHLLVWNNDYRQLEKELRGQVRRRVGVGVGSSPEPR